MAAATWSIDVEVACDDEDIGNVVESGVEVESGVDDTDVAAESGVEVKREAEEVAEVEEDTRAEVKSELKDSISAVLESEVDDDTELLEDESICEVAADSFDEEVPSEVLSCAVDDVTAELEVDVF